MAHAEITTTEPSSNSKYIDTISQISHLTPKQAHRWNQAALPVISTVRSGTQACTVIVGESPERRVLFQRDEELKRFKIQIVQHELIVECYRLFGNKHPEFSDSDETIVGRNAFDKEFLLQVKDLLEEFISDSYHPIYRNYFLIPRTTPISITHLLDLVNPARMLKDANSSAHNITYDDIWLVLLLMKEMDVTNWKWWEELVVLVIDDEGVSSWRSNREHVKSRCKAKRDQMEYHMLQKEAEEFEEARLLEQRKRLFKKLERQGLVVSRQKFNIMLFIVFGILAMGFIVLAHLVTKA